MTVNQDLLANIAASATQSSSHALSLLVGKEVTVRTTQAHYLPLDKLLGMIDNQGKTNIVAFSQLISGVDGAALLILSRDDALSLVDTLLRRPAGTTKVLADIDTSAIKETLNILSNSQLTALARDLGITINVMPPSMISIERISQVLNYLSANQQNHTEIIAFETSLVVTGQESQVTMFIIFDGGLAGIIASKEGTP